MALTQYKDPTSKTYFGYDPGTNQAIAFADEATFKQYFPQGFQGNAPAPTFDTSGLLNANANKLINLGSPATNANTQGSTIAAPGGAPGANPVQPPNPPSIPGGSLTDAYNQFQNLSQNVPNSYDLYKEELKSRGIDTLVQQEADIGKSALAQEQALKPLLPENVQFEFPKSMKELQDVGVTQDQLNRLAAKERAPIAAALSDLLKSQSIIAQQIDRQTSFAQYLTGLKQKDYQQKLDLAKLNYEFVSDQTDRQFASTKDARDFALENTISTPFYFVGGEVRRTADGKAYSTPEQFFKDAGVTSFDEAVSRRLLSNATDAKVKQQNFENALAVQKLASSGSGSGSGGIPTSSLPGSQALINAFNSAIIGLPALSQKGAKQTFQNYLNQGDIEGAKQFVLTVATQGLPVDQQNQLIGRAEATDALTNIQTLLDQAKQKGAGTNYFSGNLEYTAQKLGASSNPDLAYLGSLINQQFIIYRRAMTGVAFSPGESSDYKKIFPDITNLASLNTAKIQALQDTFNMNNRAALSVYLGGSKNYDSIYGAPKGLSLPSDTTPSSSTNTPAPSAETKSFWQKLGSWIGG